LELDILRAYDATVDIERQTLRLVEEEISFGETRGGALKVQSSSGQRSNNTGSVQGNSDGHSREPLRVENGLVDPSPLASPPQGIYIARTLIQNRQEVPVRDLNTTHRDPKLPRGSPLAHCEPRFGSPPGSRVKLQSIGSN
jgi:hypothetical protein